MSIRFSPGRTPESSHVARVVRFRGIPLPANDTGQKQGIPIEALRHFSLTGLEAGLKAREHAEQALGRGDREGFERWRDICACFDRRAATRLDHMAELRKPA